MTTAPPGQWAPSRAARLVHLSLLVTPAGFFVLALALGMGGAAEGTPASTTLRWGALGVGAVLVAVAAILRGTIPPRRPEEDPEAWWRAHLPRAAMVWSMAEAVGVAGAGLGVAGGDLLGAAPLVAASTLLLLHLAPGRLEGGRK